MRTARPLVPSPGMQRVLRIIAVVREAATSRGEIEVIADTTPMGRGTLDVGALDAIETELGTELHDDVLIVLAAGIPMLTTATALKIDLVLDRLDDADVPAGWVPIAWVSERPFEARRSRGEHGGGLYDVCVPVPPRHDSFVAVDGFFDVAFPGWVEDQLRQELGQRSDWLELSGRVASVTDVSTFALVGTAPDRIPPASRRVVHDKFGAGTVVRELDGGAKLVIAFADGERTLAARFVRDVIA